MADAPVNLRRIFADICRGYTKYDWNKKPVYVKHLTHFEQVDIDEYRDKFLLDSKRRGIPDLAQQLAFLEREGLWLKSNQAELETQKFYLDNLHKTKSKMAIRAQIDMIDKTIKEAEEKYYKLLDRKNSLVGDTAEKYADQRMQAYYIYNTFHKDAKLEEKLFTEKQFINLDEEELVELMSFYIRVIQEFSHTNLKKISISDFFSTYFGISENNEGFFGRPPCFLSYYQINLLSYGSYFKSILSNHKIPEELKDDPEKIESYVVKAQNMKAMYEKAGKTGGSVGFVGASREDLASLGPAVNPTIHRQMNKGNISTLTEALEITGG